MPEHWLPLLPDLDRIGTLLRGLATRTSGVEIVGSEPCGRVLEPGRQLLLLEEAVPREGVIVSRAYRYACTSNGQRVLWIGRKKRPGHGEASSGLRFDIVE